MSDDAPETMIASDWISATACALPWVLAPAVTAWRWRDAPSLDDVSSNPPLPAPRLSVIVPARNEARHIVDCVRSILTSTYPALEVIVVDDHSHDGTGALARSVAGNDPRLTVIVAPRLPPGWLGKQWACENGAGAAAGEILLFTDADVRHGPELHARVVVAMERERADLLSVVGQQQTASFWERVVQPFVFSTLAHLYGGPGAVNRSRRAHGKIANGQCLAFRRAAYDAVGGHAAVRGSAAEDLAFAQLMFARGFRTHFTMGLAQMSTRMYASLREIIDGWGKNVYAAGRETLPGGRLAPAVASILVPAPAVFALVPPAALALGALGTGGRVLTAFGAIATCAQLVWYGSVMHRFRIPLPYALLFPLAAIVYLYIALTAVARGSRVTWKGRSYDVHHET